MTRLILILALFAVAAQGQDSVYVKVDRNWKWVPVTSSQDEFERILDQAEGKSIGFVSESHLTVKSLLDLYAQYEQNCLRDTVIDNDYVELSRGGRIWYKMSSARIEELDKAFGVNYVDTLYPYIRPAWKPRITPNGLDSNFILWLRRLDSPTKSR